MNHFTAPTFPATKDLAKFGRGITIRAQMLSVLKRCGHLDFSTVNFGLHHLVTT